MHILVDKELEQREEGKKGRRESDTRAVTKRVMLRQTIIVATLFFTLGLLYERIFG